jgi:hypothetical protein
MNQPIQCHGAGQLHGAWSKPQTLEDGVDPEPVLELESDVDRSGRARLGGRDAVGVDGDEIIVGRFGGGFAGRRLLLLLVDLTDDLIDFGIRICKQVVLPDQSIFDPSSQSEPLGGGPWTEVSQGADDLLSWSLGGLDGLVISDN